MTQHTIIRLASKARGDDVTLSRKVKQVVDGPARTKGSQVAMPTAATPFVVEGRSKFHRKGVYPIADMARLLVSGINNLKVGRDVRKGRLSGYWIFTLSLEERATCPSTCKHWLDCYGNNMPFARRADHTDPEFLPTLAAEIAALVEKRGKVLVRLHALGDFYSEEYVRFWGDMLMQHQGLAIFGYTARPPETPIGIEVAVLNERFEGRAAIRFSDGPGATMSTRSIAREEDCPADAFVCPEQTGKTKACATCGACWSTPKNVAFIAH